MSFSVFNTVSMGGKHDGVFFFLHYISRARLNDKVNLVATFMFFPYKAREIK